MSKYSFETTTIGEMLDTPEIKALIEKIVPEALESPTLELGRSFIFNDALPYISEMVSDEQLEQFKTELENLN